MIPHSSVVVPEAAAGADRSRVLGRRPGTRTHELDVARQIARGVLGAGMLVMPPVVLAVAEGADLLLWVAHIVLGGTVSLLLGSLMVRTGWAPMPLSTAAGAALGSWARITIDLCFVVAFAAGQAAIVWFVATAVRAVADRGPAAVDGPWLMIALAGMITAALVALSPLRIPDAVTRGRPWFVGLLAVACGSRGWPVDESSSGVTPFAPVGISGGAALWLAFAALFFAGVGWEAVTETETEAGSEKSLRRTARGVALGAGIVSIVYLGLAAMWRWAPIAGAGPTFAALDWLLAAATAVVLASYVVTNLRAAAGIAARLPGGHRGDGGLPRSLVIAVGALSCAFVVLGNRDGAVPLLLLGPAAGATVAYVLAAVAAVKRGGPVGRRVGGPVVLLLVAFASFAVPSLRTAWT